MKKLFFIFALFLPIYALATDMCARDDTMVFVFDKLIGATASGNNATEWSWWVSFSYGRIAGDATCLSLSESLGQTTQGAYYGTDEYVNTFISADAGLSGSDSDGGERKYCWCRMRHPFMSNWVLRGVNNSGAPCAPSCANNCAYSVRTETNMWRNMLNSIGL